MRIQPWKAKGEGRGGRDAWRREEHYSLFSENGCVARSRPRFRHRRGGQPVPLVVRDEKVRT